MSRLLAVLAVTLALTGCGSGFDGSWVGSWQMTQDSVGGSIWLRVALGKVSGETELFDVSGSINSDDVAELELRYPADFDRPSYTLGANGRLTMQSDTAVIGARTTGSLYIYEGHRETSKRLELMLNKE